MTIDELIAGIVHREKGYVDHPSDRGGATKYGIAKATLAGWRGRAVTKSEVRDLTIQEATAIYRVLYVDRPGFDDLPEPLRLQVVDFGVHSGPGTATRVLQKTLGVTVDGVLGPQTRAAAMVHPGRTAIRLWQERLRFLGWVAINDPGKQRDFWDGWVNRMIEIMPTAGT